MVSEKDSEEAEESDEETQAEPKLQTKQVKLLADALIRKMGNPSGLSKELKQLHEKVLEQSQASGTKEREHAHAILELAQASGAKELKHAHAILEQAQAIATSERAQAMESASSERAQAARQTDMFVKILQENANTLKEVVLQTAKDLGNAALQRTSIAPAAPIAPAALAAPAAPDAVTFSKPPSTEEVISAWLKLNGIAHAADVVSKLVDLGVCEGVQILMLDQDDWASCGFLKLPIILLQKLKAKQA